MYHHLSLLAKYILKVFAKLNLKLKKYLTDCQSLNKAQMCVWRRTLTVYVLFNCREVKKNIFAQNHNLKVFQCKVALTDAKLRGLCTGQLWSFLPEKASLLCVPCKKS